MYYSRLEMVSFASAGPQRVTVLHAESPLKSRLSLLRACWPCCPGASTGWTCTTAPPTLARWRERRPAWRGRTSSTSSTSCWVSDGWQGNVHIFRQRCQAVDHGAMCAINLPAWLMMLPCPNLPALGVHTTLQQWFSTGEVSGPKYFPYNEVAIQIYSTK